MITCCRRQNPMLGPTRDAAGYALNQSQMQRGRRKEAEVVGKQVAKWPTSCLRTPREPRGGCHGRIASHPDLLSNHPLSLSLPMPACIAHAHALVTYLQLHLFSVLSL